MRRKRKKHNEAATPAPVPEICRWCGESITPGEESGNLYEPGAEAEAKGVTSMGHVHAEHVSLEEHPMYEQMPHIVFTGLPDEFYE